MIRSQPIARALLALTMLAAGGCASIEGRARARLADPALAGTRWGLVVSTMDGRELVAIRPDERFVPASNTKIVTTVAALARLSGADASDPRAGASLTLEPGETGAAPDLVLVGHGDAMLSDRAECLSDCLALLADAVVQNGVTRVRNVIGDDTLFPDERWGQGWSWNNMETRSGTAYSALTINDNELAIDVRPADAANAPAIVSWREGDAIHALANDVVTTEAGESHLWAERRPGSPDVRVHGAIVRGSAPRVLVVGVEDPAAIAAERLRRRLVQRGVEVEGDVRVRHRPNALADDPALRAKLPAPSIRLAPAGVEIARLAPPPLIDDITLTLKISQNLHAELMLHRLGLAQGGGSAGDGLSQVEAVLGEAGLERSSWDFSDGSGMSTYNRITPRGMIRLLLWTRRQPWGEAWRAALPVGGVDGSLTRRFRGTALEGKVFAKTGSLNAVNALSGFMVAASGRMLVFSAFANDRPGGTETTTPAMDAALVAIAAAY